MIILGLVVGTGIGILLRSGIAIKADKNQQLVWLPGSYLSLITFLIIFAAHFVVGYLQAVVPGYLQQQSFGELLVLFALTVASGLTVGTNLCVYIKYHRAESEGLLLVASK